MNKLNRIIFFLLIKNRIVVEMGNVQYLCQNQLQQRHDFMVQELNLYKWRSNPNHNTFIARTSFKNAYYHKQQQEFAHFIEQQHQSPYLEIFKFKEDDHTELAKKKEEIIMFQKYKCTLKQLEGKMPIDDALYALHSLLFGFEEIKKLYNTIVVEMRCCFVTVEGEIRAWINPNCKANRVWSPTNQHIISHTKIKDILIKILQIVESLALRHIKMDQLIRILRSYIYKPTMRNYSFVSFRKIINQFCYTNNITMSNNLINTLKQSAAQQQQQQQKVPFRVQNTCMTMPNDIKSPNQYKNIIQTSNMQSQLRYDTLLTRSKSFGGSTLINMGKSNDFKYQSKLTYCNSNMAKPTDRNPIDHGRSTNKISNINCKSNIIHYAPSTDLNNFNNMRSAILTRHSSSNKGSMKQHSQNFVNVNVNGQSSLKNSKIIISQNINQAINLLNVKPMYGNQLSKQLSFSALKEQNIKLENDSIKISDHVKVFRDSHNHNNNNCKQREKEEDSKIRYVRNLHKTQTLGQSQSQSYQTNDLNAENRGWITSKTITKLISAKDEKQILNISIGESSSQYYNNSDYSGALSNMGRSIVKRDSKKTKTVRVSRQY